MIRDIASEVRLVVRQQLDVDEARIMAGSSFTEDLGADSLSLVELTIALEAEFDIDITDEDAEGMLTVQDAIDRCLDHTIACAITERRGA